MISQETLLRGCLRRAPNMTCQDDTAGAGWKSSGAEDEICSESERLDQAAPLGIKSSHCKLLPGWTEFLRTTAFEPVYSHLRERLEQAPDARAAD